MKILLYGTPEAGHSCLPYHHTSDRTRRVNGRLYYYCNCGKRYNQRRKVRFHAARKLADLTS